VRRYISEFIGTFILVLAICGALMVDTMLHQSFDNVPIIVFLVVTSLVYTLGPVSGCNINPAVTIGIWLLGRMRGRDVIPYIIAQLAGGVAASLVLLAVLGNVDHLGMTIAQPGFFGWRGAAIEAMLTFGLMFAVAMTFHEKFEQLMSGLAVGAALAVGAYWGAPLSGGSINPARSFGPALVLGDFKDFWIYIVGPIAGSVLATLLAKYVLLPAHDARSPMRLRLLREQARRQQDRGPKLAGNAR